MFRWNESKKFKKFVRDGCAPSLTDAERAKIRGAVSSFVHAHPVRIAAPARHVWQRSFIHSLVPVRLQPMPFVMSILLASLLFGGGVSYAAEHSLPGDPLYPVKLEVNDNVRLAAALTPEAKARVHMQLAEDRVREAEQISAREHGDINAAVRTEVEQNFSAHAAAAHDELTQLATSGQVQAAAKLRANFEADLTAHEHILAALENRDAKIDAQVAAENGNTATSTAEVAPPAMTSTTGDADITGDARSAAAHVRAQARAQIRLLLRDVHADVQARAGTEANDRVELEKKILEGLPDGDASSSVSTTSSSDTTNHTTTSTTVRNDDGASIHSNDESAGLKENTDVHVNAGSGGSKVQVQGDTHTQIRIGL